LHLQGPQGVNMSKILYKLWQNVAKPILNALGYLVHSFSI
jgi:hypothetical protein